MPGRLIEVHAAAALEVCAECDGKDLHARSVQRVASRGRAFLTSGGQVYEALETPELVLDGGAGASGAALAQQVVERIAVEADGHPI